MKRIRYRLERLESRLKPIGGVRGIRLEIVGTELSHRTEHYRLSSGDQQTELSRYSCESYKTFEQRVSVAYEQAIADPTTGPPLLIPSL